MPKTFYTERDIEDLAAQGVQSLHVDENTVLTELAREAARKLGIQLTEHDERPSSAPHRPYLSDKEKPARTAAPAAAAVRFCADRPGWHYLLRRRRQRRPRANPRPSRRL